MRIRHRGRSFAGSGSRRLPFRRTSSSSGCRMISRPSRVRRWKSRWSRRWRPGAARKGGRLRIEPTAAGVAIDVDGGGRASLETNLDAAAEIARQVRLRNLGGTIFIDFIDLAQRGDQRRLEEAVKRAFRRDLLPVEVHTLPALGLVVLSRARRGEPLSARLQRPCPRCEGRAGSPACARRAPPGRVAGPHRAAGQGPSGAGPGGVPLRRGGGTLAAVADQDRAGCLMRDPALAPGSYRVEG